MNLDDVKRKLRRIRLRLKISERKGSYESRIDLIQSINAEIIDLMLAMSTLRSTEDR